MYITPRATNNTIYEAMNIQSKRYLFELDASIRFYYTYKGMRHAYLLVARIHKEHRSQYVNYAIEAHRNVMFYLQNIRREVKEYQCQLKRLQMMN